MKNYCVPGEYHHARDWRACLWIPETFAEWNTAIALLVLMIYLVREYGLPLLKGCVPRRFSVLQAVDTAVPLLTSALPSWSMPMSLRT